MYAFVNKFVQVSLTCYCCWMDCGIWQKIVVFQVSCQFLNRCKSTVFHLWPQFVSNLPLGHKGLHRKIQNGVWIYPRVIQNSIYFKLFNKHKNSIHKIENTFIVKASLTTSQCQSKHQKYQQSMTIFFLSSKFIFPWNLMTVLLPDKLRKMMIQIG